jgi:hypothetical protein
LQTGIHVCFIHEGDLLNLLLEIPEFLNNLFPEQWIVGGGPKSRRARCLDLNPLYFYLWRYLTLNLLTTTIVAPPSNASKWQMGFNSAFKGLKSTFFSCRIHLRPGLATANS